MKSYGLRWAVSGAALLIGVAYLLFQSRGAIPKDADVSAYELNLVADRCASSEAVDRWLLQQSWFHDPGFTQLAGAFGQTSFSLYSVGESRKEIEGAFCISGTDLMVRYYERRFVPVRVDLSKLSVLFGTRLEPMSQDVFSVRALTKEKMILVFASDGHEHVFYRKN